MKLHSERFYLYRADKESPLSVVSVSSHSASPPSSLCSASWMARPSLPKSFATMSISSPSSPWLVSSSSTQPTSSPSSLSPSPTPPKPTPQSYARNSSISFRPSSTAPPISQPPSVFIYLPKQLKNTFANYAILANSNTSPMVSIVKHKFLRKS